jgi:hypothetical protein
MTNWTKGTMSDYPEHRAHLQEQAQNRGMETCTTQAQRERYARRLIRGIFKSDLPNVSVVGETTIVYGDGSLTRVPELENLKETWRNFPKALLIRIINEEQKAARDQRASSDLGEGEGLGEIAA